MGVQQLHFFNLAPTLGRVKSCVPHGTWRFNLDKYTIKGAKGTISMDFLYFLKYKSTTQLENFVKIRP
jgi:hypothetical protein